MTTSYKDAGVAEALLKAGARLEDLDDGRSALWYAACAGNWRVVTVLLRAGANARGAADISAVECTRRARQDELNRRRTVLDRGRPTVQDFDQVIALLISKPIPVPATAGMWFRNGSAKSSTAATESNEPRVHRSATR